MLKCSKKKFLSDSKCMCIGKISDIVEAFGISYERNWNV